MKKAEITFIALAFVGVLFKFLHYPGSEELIIISFSSLSVLYMYFGFALFNNIKLRSIFKKTFYTGISSKRIIGGIGAGAALSFSAIGLMFKFQSFPGSLIQLGIGLFALTIVAIISLVKNRKRQDEYYQNILKRVIAFALVSAFLMAIPYKTWLTWKYPGYPEFVNAILEADADPENEALWEKVAEEEDKMRADYTDKSE